MLPHSAPRCTSACVETSTAGKSALPGVASDSRSKQEQQRLWAHTCALVTPCFLPLLSYALHVCAESALNGVRDAAQLLALRIAVPVRLTDLGLAARLASGCDQRHTDAVRAVGAITGGPCAAVACVQSIQVRASVGA